MTLDIIRSYKFQYNKCMVISTGDVAEMSECKLHNVSVLTFRSVCCAGHVALLLAIEPVVISSLAQVSHPCACPRVLVEPELYYTLRASTNVLVFSTKFWSCKQPQAKTKTYTPDTLEKDLSS